MPSQLLVAHLGHAASLFGLPSEEEYVSHLAATSKSKLMLLAVMTP
jgi:hypothetical protein